MKTITINIDCKNNDLYTEQDVVNKINRLLEDIAEECDMYKDKVDAVARNTKFIICEMSGCSNSEYKQLLEDYRMNRLKKPSDPYIKEVVDILGKDYGFDLDSTFVSYAKRNIEPRRDSPFQTVAIIDIINAMIKLKEKLNEEKN